MRFYNQAHRYYAGVDLHARTLYACILDGDGEVLVHRQAPTTRDAADQVLAGNDQYWSSSYQDLETVRAVSEAVANLESGANGAEVGRDLGGLDYPPEIPKAREL